MPPHRLFLEKPQVNRRIEYLDPTASDPRAGACGTLYNLCCDPRFNYELPITAGVRAVECSTLLTSFFNGRRAP